MDCNVVTPSSRPSSGAFLSPQFHIDLNEPRPRLGDSLKNVPLKKRIISRINSNKFVLTITLFLSGTFFKDSRNLYPTGGVIEGVKMANS